jgi:hypothetical protein
MGADGWPDGDLIGADGGPDGRPDGGQTGCPHLVLQRFCNGFAMVLQRFCNDE